MVMGLSFVSPCVLIIRTGRIYWEGDRTNLGDLWTQGTRHKYRQWEVDSTVAAKLMHEAIGDREAHSTSA